MQSLWMIADWLNSIYAVYFIYPYKKKTTAPQQYIGKQTVLHKYNSCISSDTCSAVERFRLHIGR